MSDFKIPRTSTWGNLSLSMFRLVRAELQKRRLTNASLSMLLCVILKNTYLMRDYFNRRHISDEDLDCLIKNRMQLNCYKIHPKKGTSTLFSTSYMKSTFDLQLFSVKDHDNSTISFWATSEFIDIMMKTIINCQEAGLKDILPICIIATMFYSDSQELRDFLFELKLDYEDAKKYYLAASPFMFQLEIPEELSGVLSILNDKIDISKPCEILNRENECQSAWNIMLKRNNHNALIIGECGQGKTSMVEKLTYDIMTERSPKQFYGFKVISVDVHSLIRELSNLPKYAQLIIDFVKSRTDVIVFIDDIHELVLFQEQGEFDIISTLEPLLTDENAIIIATLGSDVYVEPFCQYDISKRFEFLHLQSVLLKNMYSMLKLKIQSLSEYHQISITDKMAKFAIKVGHGLFSQDGLGFHSILGLIDASMATSKRIGLKSVTRNAILQNCHLLYYVKDTISRDALLSTAIHESSHYVVISSCKENTHLVATTIIVVPDSNSYGVTFSAFDNYINAPADIDYYIDYMAFMLAGRVGEELFGYKTNNGHKQDLSRAMQKAFEAIDDLDLLGIDYKISSYTNAESSSTTSSEWTKRRNKKAKELIAQATKRAQQIIESNKDVILAIANALLENPVMIDDDINPIWNDTVSKRNNASEVITENS